MNGFTVAGLYSTETLSAAWALADAIEAVDGSIVSIERAR